MKWDGHFTEVKRDICWYECHVLRSEYVQIIYVSFIRAVCCTYQTYNYEIASIAADSSISVRFPRNIMRAQSALWATPPSTSSRTLSHHHHHALLLRRRGAARTSVPCRRGRPCAAIRCRVSNTHKHRPSHINYQAGIGTTVLEEWPWRTSNGLYRWLLVLASLRMGSCEMDLLVTSYLP